MNYTSYVTQDKDRWDSIANKMYGDPTLAPLILAVNGDVSILAELPGGITLKIPIRTDPLTGNDLPPWATDEDNTVENPDGTDTSIPVNPAPIVELSFAPGYPVVEGNRIKFAINQSKTYPYSVEKVSGGVVASSPSYIFTAGFPVTTQEIVEGDVYVVKVGSLVSLPLTVVGTSQPLSFHKAPYFDSFLSTLYIRTAINKTGSYLTKITRLSDSVVVYNSTDSYTLEVEKGFTIASPGNYKIEIGSLSANVTVALTEITEVPAWLIKLALSYAYVSRECTIYVQATENVEVAVERVDGNETQGLTHDDSIWVSGVYTPGTTEWISLPYTELFRFNPSAPGAAGIANGTAHRIKVRREANRNEVFVYTFTSPIGDTPITEFDLTPEGVTECQRGPFINSPINATSTQLSFSLDADDVRRFKYRVKDSIPAIIKSGVVNMVNEVGTPIFSPTNVPIINVATLVPGNYTLEIEGDSCSSDVSTRAFTVADDGGGPPIVTGPVTPKEETASIPEQATFTVSGSTEDWTINDISTNSAPAGYNYMYFVDGKIYRQGGKLTNFHWPSNRSLWIWKFQVRADLTQLRELGGGNTDRISGLSYGVTSAGVQLHFNEFGA